MDDRFWEILGYDPQKMPSKSSTWRDIINQDDLKAALTNFNQHIEDPNIPYDQVLRFTHKKGRTVWIRSKGMAIRNEENKAIRMVGSHLEITELKENEEFLHRCNQEANIGFWDMSVENKTIKWSNTTKAIHGVDLDFKPCLETSINFYKEGSSRTKITELVFRALILENLLTKNYKLLPYKANTNGLRLLVFLKK
ncbi:PAS protein [Algibacter lectus]|uniref:histidine kinase n=1 Tax=Algibacter lectus TaxID=221126 RepID=A0A090X721_9FLAO|nr:PAS protein [Algibacter lectus]